MSEHNILQIRETIALAKRQEMDTRALLTYIEQRLPSMHPAIELPETNASKSLFDFVTRYIEHVPDFIEALADYMKEAKIYDEAKGLLKIAVDFFISPPEVVNQHSGLQALIDEAYLAHRLMEEINDRLLVISGHPLTPMDMTMSNLVIHDLIGEDFANQLDMIVLYTIERSFQNEKLAKLVKNPYIEAQQKKDWEEALKKWPCLAGDNAISISLEEKQAANTDSKLH